MLLNIKAYHLDNFFFHLYKLNRFLSETILKALYTSLIHPYSSCDFKAWNIYQNYTSKIFVHHEKSIRSINNLPYNEHTNVNFKCSKILRLSDQ